MPVLLYEEQQTMMWNWFSPPAFAWVLGMNAQGQSSAPNTFPDEISHQPLSDISEDGDGDYSC